MVSLTAANTSRMFDVSVAWVRLEEVSTSHMCTHVKEPTEGIDLSVLGSPD